MVKHVTLFMREKCLRVLIMFAKSVYHTMYKKCWKDLKLLTSVTIGYTTYITGLKPEVSSVVSLCKVQ